MKKISILSLALLAVFAFTAIAFAFGETNAPNANSNAHVSRGFTPERNAVNNVTNMVRNDIRNAKNYIGEKTAAVERAVDYVQETATNVTTRVNDQNAIERTASEISGNARHEYDSFRENFDGVIEDKVVTLKQNFKTSISNVSKRINERVINPIGNTVGNTVQNSGGAISTTVNSIFRRY